MVGRAMTQTRLSRDPRWRRATRLGAVALAGIGLLAGCGAASLPGTPARTAADEAADSPQPADGPADPAAGLVAAVNPGDGSSSPLQVKFRVEARPQVGMPVKILVALIPAGTSSIHHLHGSFLAGDGLELQSSRGFDVSDLPANNAPVYREVTVVPHESGVLSLTATVLVDLDKSSESRSYAIPLIATDSSS